MKERFKRPILSTSNPYSFLFYKTKSPIALISFWIVFLVISAHSSDTPGKDQPQIYLGAQNGPDTLSEWQQEPSSGGEGTTNAVHEFK